MKLFFLLLSIFVVSVLNPLVSLASSGTVILARGVVTATGANNADRVLIKGAAIEEGDVIKTAKKSFAVIRMLDNTKLTLKPGTVMAIGKFSLEEGKEEACINLVRGGLRTVTGLIGKRKPDSFQVDTPIASIGIRGTDFITRICAGDECLVDEPELPLGEFGNSAEQDKIDAAEAINNSLPEGMYGSCETGAIVMSQCAGQAEGFQLGSCRISQRKDCTEVGLSPGQAGYTGVQVVETSDSLKEENNRKEGDDSEGGSSEGSSSESSSSDSSSNDSSSSNVAKSSGTKSSATNAVASKSGSAKETASQSSSVQNGAEQTNGDAVGNENQESALQQGISQNSNAQATSAENTGSSLIESQSGPVGNGSPPVVLTKSPDILSKDPYFKLSDMSDDQLDQMERFPDRLGSTGQCSI